MRVNMLVNLMMKLILSVFKSTFSPLVTSQFWRFTRWTHWISFISLCNTVLIWVETWLRARTIGLMIRPFPRNSWMYIPTLPNPIAVWKRSLSGRLDFNISLRLLVYCCLVQAKVMAIYLTYGAPLTRVSIFSDSHAAINSLLNTVNNSNWQGILPFHNLLSRRISVTLI